MNRGWYGGNRKQYVHFQVVSNFALTRSDSLLAGRLVEASYLRIALRRALPAPMPGPGLSKGFAGFAKPGARPLRMFTRGHPFEAGPRPLCMRIRMGLYFRVPRMSPGSPRSAKEGRRCLHTSYFGCGLLG